MSPPAQFIRRGSIHSEYDVLPEELGRYVGYTDTFAEHLSVKKLILMCVMLRLDLQMQHDSSMTPERRHKPFLFFVLVFGERYFKKQLWNASLACSRLFKRKLRVNMRNSFALIWLLLTVIGCCDLVFYYKHVISIDASNGHDDSSCLQRSGPSCQTLEYVQKHLKSVSSGSLEIEICQPGINLTKAINITNITWLW